MREITGALASTLQSNVTTLCRLVDVAITSGRVFRFTDSDFDVIYAGNVYSSQYGCSVSQVRSTLGTDAESVTATVIMDPGAITSALVEGGALDNATMRVLVIDYTNPAVASVFFVGSVTQLDFTDGLTVAMSANPALSQDRTLAGDVFSSNCRADLGDAKCRASVPSEAHTLTAVDSLQVLHTDSGNPDGTWAWGLAVFTSGENDGFSFEIADSMSDGTIVLRGIMPQPPAVGDGVTLYQGCDKTPTMCSQRYNNIANFRGEPFAVAPWIVTSEAPDDGSTDSADTSPPSKVFRQLYVYWNLNAFYKGPIGNGNVSPSYAKPPFPDNPEWGPVKDEWGMGNYDENGKPVNYSQGASGRQQGYIDFAVCIAPDIQAGVERGSGQHTYTDVVGWNERRPLTQAEMDVVRRKYPDA